MVQQMTARERILTLHAQGMSPELIASEVFTTIEHVMNVIVTAPDAAQYPALAGPEIQIGRWYRNNNTGDEELVDNVTDISVITRHDTLADEYPIQVFLSDWSLVVWPEVPASALATAQPAADTDQLCEGPDDYYDNLSQISEERDMYRRGVGSALQALVNLTKERDRLKQDCANLREACQSALELLDKQREEYNSMFTLLPRETVEEGPIAKALRAAIAQAEAP